MARKNEINLVLNTGEGQVSYTTDSINGKLGAIIIETPSKIALSVMSELGYLILKKAEIENTHYFAVRSRTTAPDESLMDYPDFEEFILDEPLIITIIGQKNQDVSITFRFS